MEGLTMLWVLGVPITMMINQSFYFGLSDRERAELLADAGGKTILLFLVWVFLGLVWPAFWLAVLAKGGRK